MKPKLYLLSLIVLHVYTLQAQITAPAVRANFGVEADLRSNYITGTGIFNDDDWFNKLAFNTGIGVIDTTGAAAIVAGYTSSPATRTQSFTRPMSVAPYSVVNNMLLLDAFFCRDYHGDDSTVFASGSNKNGMSPANWTCPVAQSIPDKNDILDAFTHIRRAGPSVTDSLWLFGGVSIQNTTGNRYFDFELYQTDIVYNRSTRTFSGYGADAGHTAWLFDAAGNVTRAGDIIFSAEYSSSSLTLVQARIWVSSNTFNTVTPVNFNWGGQFDGASAGATYGYASITPKTAGAFYTGLQCVAGVWSGPFSLVLDDNSVVTAYADRQFMEFSVNLSKLGLDPGVFANNPCAVPFKRMIIKSRASTSFTAELKDFVAPFRLFNYPQVDAFTYIVYQCETFVPTVINVVNPSPNSTYTWSTPNGVIIGPTTGTSITAGAPGTYRVQQQLNLQCPQYAMDSVVLLFDFICHVLPVDFTRLQVKEENNSAFLSWQVSGNNEVAGFIIEQSTDGIHFTALAQVAANNDAHTAGYSYAHPLAPGSGTVYYRIKVFSKEGKSNYSETVMLRRNKNNAAESLFYPNPTQGVTWFESEMPANETAALFIWDMQGKRIVSTEISLRKGKNRIKLEWLNGRPEGYYLIKIKSAATDITGKIIVVH